VYSRGQRQKEKRRWLTKAPGREQSIGTLLQIAKPSRDALSLTSDDQCDLVTHHRHVSWDGTGKAWQSPLCWVVSLSLWTV